MRTTMSRRMKKRIGTREKENTKNQNKVDTEEENENKDKNENVLEQILGYQLEQN